MTRWQRFKHAFVACRGPVVAREYIPPGGEISGRDPRAVQLVEETLYGVTLFHQKCSTCGARYVNREIGDWRYEEGKGEHR